MTTRFFFLTTLLLAAAAPAQALTCTWNTGTVGTWETAANWSCLSIPGPGDDVTISSGTVTLGANHTVRDFTFTNGTVQGTGTLNVAGALLWNFGTMNTDLRLLATGSGTLASSTKTIGPGASVRLDANTTWTAGSIFGRAGAVLDNNATLTSTTNQAMSHSGNPIPRPVFDNDGTFRHDHPSTASNFFVLDNGGTVQVLQGISNWREGGTNTGTILASAGAEFELIGSSAFTNTASGVIGGSGTFDDPSPTASFVNNGTFAPGTSPGLLTYDGNYAMSASSVLDIELGGTVPGDDYDQLAVTGNGSTTGNATLGGTLRLRIAVGAAPQIGDAFTVLTAAGDVTGTFDTTAVPFGYTFSIIPSRTDEVTVIVLSVPNFDLQAQNTSPPGSPITVPKGGSISFDYSITNNTSFPITGDFWFTAKLGTTTVAQGVLLSGTLPANFTLNQAFVQGVPTVAPTATYTYTLKIGQFPNTVVDQVPFTVMVVPPPERLPGQAGSETWAAREVEPWVGPDGAVLSVMPEQAESTAAAETEAAVEVASTAVPEVFGLAAAYPNPFRSQTTFALDVPEAVRVAVAVYDVLGRRVAVLLDEEVEAGTHGLSLDASSLPSGVYLVRMTAGEFASMQRVTLVR